MTIICNIKNTEQLVEYVKSRDKFQPSFHEAVAEVFMSIKDYLDNDRQALMIAASLIEPERIIIFRVPWTDDNGNAQYNRGYRVQFSSALGPYKGGLRFHPSVNLDVIKFLAFEQVFKNSLSGLELGGGKGGSDFDPKGKSDCEVMRFCQSFMTELSKYIGPDIDVPAGDIGVGEREIGFMFGQYKRLTNSFFGVLTGKGLEYGGLNYRTQATGYGVVYFLDEMIKSENESLIGKRVIVSGSGNVALHTVEKLLEKHAIPVTVSDSNGYIYFPEGITSEQLKVIMELKYEKRGRLKELSFGNYVENETPWKVKADIAIPCATQNEIQLEDAKNLVKNNIRYVVEGANMPSTREATEHFISNKVMFGPAKAANMGGVACSLMEMAQNSNRIKWQKEEVDRMLKEIMVDAFKKCRESAEFLNDPKNLYRGANLSAFKKLLNVVQAQGIV